METLLGATMDTPTSSGPSAAPSAPPLHCLMAQLDNLTTQVADPVEPLRRKSCVEAWLMSCPSPEENLRNDPVGNPPRKDSKTSRQFVRVDCEVSARVTSTDPAVSKSWTNSCSVPSLEHTPDFVNHLQTVMPRQSSTDSEVEEIVNSGLGAMACETRGAVRAKTKSPTQQRTFLTVERVDSFGSTRNIHPVFPDKSTSLTERGDSLESACCTNTNTGIYHRPHSPVDRTDSFDSTSAAHFVLPHRTRSPIERLDSFGSTCSNKNPSLHHRPHSPMERTDSFGSTNCSNANSAVHHRPHSPMERTDSFGSTSGGANASPAFYRPKSPFERPRPLMEQLLLAKMEGVPNSRMLLRTDSVDSTSSLSSTSSDVCRCDDCLLGIADRYTCSPEEEARQRKKPSGWRKLRNIVQWTPFFQTYKKQRYPWVQLAGHQGNFKAGTEPGTILKKLCPKEELCFQVLMKDVLRPYVPEYKGHLTCNDQDSTYLQLQDLLGDFTSPCVMDCKIGVRTYLEEELAKAKEKPKLRKDMYDKMIQIDSEAPTDEEHRLKGVTKPRYMVWRETISSTATLGFRIEGIKKSDGKSSKDFKTTKSRAQITGAFKDFTAGFPQSIPKYIQRLKAIKATLEVSKFFSSHEVIGSSLLFVHDHSNTNVWLIDFAKTLVLPPGVAIDHGSKWIVGNHEDGYYIGINNLISIFEELLEEQCHLPAPQVTTIVTDASEEDTT